MAKLWGFLGFCILVLILARHVVVPFVFALLVAYIFAPIVNRRSRGPDGRRRVPRGLAIILCYRRPGWLWHPWPGPPELGATRVAMILDPRH